MAGASREQAILLLTAAKNHGDLAVKISSLKQAKEILLSFDSSLASEFFPYLVELQSSPESLVRKYLVELMEELGLKVMDQSSILMPVLLALLKDDDPIVVRQSIVCGTNFFCNILEEMAVQFRQSGKVDRWLEELWPWMVKFKDAVYSIVLEPGSIGKKLVAMKFLEICVLLFTSEGTDSEATFKEGIMLQTSGFKKKRSLSIGRKGRNFNISYLIGCQPILDPAALALEANKSLDLLLDILQSANTLRGSLIIAVINCLAAIARKRPLHYSNILSELLRLDPNFETLQGGHIASIQYSLRTAFLGFLRCTHPAILESRDRLLSNLREMNAGDAADQVIRQIDKMLKNTERASRDVRLSKDNEGQTNIDDMSVKRVRYSPATAQLASDLVLDDISVNGSSSKVPLLDSDLTPVEKMISMIGALLAEGERGAESLEILISQVHPDMLADIVIANMKHLPNKPPPLTSRLGNLPVVTSLASSSGTPSQPVPPAATTIPLQPLGMTSQLVSPLSSPTGISISMSDVSPVPILPADLKRDPRKDPRRLDPRRVVGPVGVQLASVKSDDVGDMPSGFDGSSSLSRLPSLTMATTVQYSSLSLTSQCKMEPSESPVAPLTEPLPPIESVDFRDESKEIEPVLDVHTPSDLALSPVHIVGQDQLASRASDVTVTESLVATYMVESDQYSSAASSTSASEEISYDFPMLPSYIELTNEEQRSLNKLAVARIIESYRQIRATGYSQARLALLARLVAQADADDDIVVMLQNHIISDYQHQKGHELAMHVLYHLYNVMMSESEEPNCSFAAIIYEKFLLALAKSLRDSLPASDKSFSRLLGEVPYLPDSALKLLEDLCHSDGFDVHGKDIRDGDRITQGLGAVWSLILGRPPNRQACLNVALKCAVHSHDDVRAKAIRLVANKLYLLSYISKNIEQFAKDMLLAVADQKTPDVEQTHAGSNEQRTEANVVTQETSISGSQNSEPGASESDSTKGVQLALRSGPTLSLSQAQCHMSLFFALCTKNPCLLQHVFDIYGRAPKAVKQAVHRHIPIVVRTLGSSCSELLRIISDPPHGSENLLMLVLQILTEETMASANLIATVKHLYATKLKDAAILIPMLSSLSKDEVLPIFPRLVDLPLEKFQTALARILQGSAHTGPALTPTEVLVAIHDIDPERHGIALKKITDACSACFEQRTVFTQQVLARALNQMVEQTPLPLLFMRTVIQSIDAFPALVDFVMEILSKLVSKQIWKMPKLWVGFLKCASQTQPHSFRVLLQLPPPQLESALSRHANLRGPLATHANQPIIRTSLPRATLVVLGLVNESQTSRSYLPASIHASDTSSSIHGATLT
ncbi:symplekin isoform X2 [Tasmannia lanceolata]|uniref:symplekin isoform X2 n=1 Tax=Tasmannia lanceolata TaxID=3420 RepID=UPI004062D4C9